MKHCNSFATACVMRRRGGSALPWSGMLPKVLRSTLLWLPGVPLGAKGILHFRARIGFDTAFDVWPERRWPHRWHGDRCQRSWGAQSFDNGRERENRPGAQSDRGYRGLLCGALYLASSTYKVTVQQTGFAQWRTTGIPISVGQERTVNAVLQPASVTTEVTVAAGELTLLDTSSAAVGAQHQFQRSPPSHSTVGNCHSSICWRPAPRRRAAGASITFVSAGGQTRKMRSASTEWKPVRLSMPRQAT